MPEPLNGHDLPATLHTPRLLLRPHRLADAEDIFGFAADAQWARFLPLPSPYERVHAEEFVASCLLQDRATSVTWAIEHDGRVVGGINARLNPTQHTAELGYSIARAHWGQGFVTEAARAVLDACFTHLPTLVRVQALADTRNTASNRVMQKIGMAHEGTMRQVRLIRGQHVDFDVYSVLRDEWGVKQ